MARRLTTVAGLVAYLGEDDWSDRQIRDLVYRRAIPFVKVGRSLRFDLREIDRWIDANSIPAEVAS